jgi:dATP pyrophosphohydrolase
MSRAPFQVLILPFNIDERGVISYAIFKRDEATGGYWQGLAGGGEGNETPLQAARREATEESNIPPESEFLALNAKAMLPIQEVCGFLWGPDVTQIPEYCFGVRAKPDDIRLSDEHHDVAWVSYPRALALLHWPSNKAALLELDRRLRDSGMAGDDL